MKVFIDVRLSSKLLSQRYGVSMVTAWRARRRGWLCPNYHQRRVVVTDKPWVEATYLLDVAKKAASYALLRTGCRSAAPFEYSDIVGSALVRLCEMVGDEQIRDRSYAFSLALGAARNFIYTRIFTPNRFNQPYQEV